MLNKENSQRTEEDNNFLNKKMEDQWLDEGSYRLGLPSLDLFFYYFFIVSVISWISFLNIEKISLKKLGEASLLLNVLLVGLLVAQEVDLSNKLERTPDFVKVSGE